MPSWAGVPPRIETDPGSESPRDRKRLARQAGLGRLSFISVLAGVLVAYGAFVLLAALVGAVAVAVGLDTELSSNDWATLGRGSAVTVTVVAFVAYLFGGYVAGRMARRAGLVNGLAVFVLALVVAVVVGAIVASQTDTEAIQANLRSLGLPVTGTEWARIGTAAGIGTLVGMLVGAGIGGVVGERWHGELVRWAAVGRGRPDHDQDDRDRAGQAQERQPERDIEDDRPAGNR
jgi:phosphotransferase system  glucose/maltose/N-acetylglucosamine-specific IIC component